MLKLAEERDFDVSIGEVLNLYHELGEVFVSELVSEIQHFLHFSIRPKDCEGLLGRVL